MSNYDLGTMLPFLVKRYDEILEMAFAHIGVVLVSLFFAALIGVGFGLLGWNRAPIREGALATAGIFLTIPSLALLAIMIPIFGLGWLPTVIALSLYSLLPILRNTIVGIREVPTFMAEAAKGMGMSKASVLYKIRLPLAWPLILAGIRVSAQLIVGVATIAAYVAGPGFGAYLFKGLSTLGSVNALNFALTGTVGVVIIALLLDGVFLLISKLTISEGIRA